MPKHLKILQSVAVAALISGPVFAENAPTAETVVASVNGQNLTLGHMITVRETLPEQYQNLPDDVLFNAILEQIIQQAVLSQSLEGEEPLRIAVTIENEHRMLRAGEAINNILDEGLSEADVQAAYDAKYQTGYVGPLEYNASHILVESEAEALEIRQVLLDGADFAETAKEKSTGPSGPGGGSLGWFGADKMVPAFSQAVVAMETGEISEPVQTRFGFHIITLHDTRTQTAPTKEMVYDELVSELQRQVVDARVASLTEAATIDRSASESLDPGLLRQSELLDPTENQ